MIEPITPSAEDAHSERPARPRTEPVVLEDLAAVLRIPMVFAKLDRVLTRMQAGFPIPSDFPFVNLALGPGNCVHDYGYRWRDEGELLQLFAGMSWGANGHDPLWEVRLEGLPKLPLEGFRRTGVHRMISRRAEGRFSEWDRFWHEETPDQPYLLGASAACTRFLEEEDPDQTAAEYLSGALHALHASGGLHAALEIARELESRS